MSLAEINIDSIAAIYIVYNITVVSSITTSREKYGSAVSSSSYISSSNGDSVDSGGVQVVDGVGVAR